MLLTGKINTVALNGGVLCGEPLVNLSLTNIAFRLSLSKAGSSPIELINTADLSTLNVGLLPYGINTFGDYDINFTSFAYDVATSTFQLDIKVYYLGTTDVVTWERFNLVLEMSKTGYQSYKNVFEFYNYDVGNVAGTVGLVDTTGNEDFNLVLIENAGNVDSYGIQQKVFSNFLTLRRPFSDEIYFYNLVGTQGGIAFSTTEGQIGSGNSGNVCATDNLLIEQTISLPTDTCTTEKMAAKKNWKPDFYTSYVSDSSCSEESINNLVGGTAKYYFDASTTSVFKINGINRFLTEFMEDRIVLNVKNYLSEITDTDEFASTLTYALWTSTPASFLTPVEWMFNINTLGTNTLEFINSYYYAAVSDIVLLEDTKPYVFNGCSFYTIEATETCGIYTIKNCGVNTLTVVTKKMDSTKTFVQVFNNTILATESLNLTLVDGVYSLEFTSADFVGTQYFTLPVFCALTTCFLEKLKETLCTPPSETNCENHNHYMFNAFVIDYHTFILLLSEEVNFNYIYSTITAAKIEELYTIQNFIDRLAEYCGDNTTSCKTCN